MKLRANRILTSGDRGTDRDRTDYLRHAMAALYQVSYGPRRNDASRGLTASRLKRPRAVVLCATFVSGAALSRAQPVRQSRARDQHAALPVRVRV
jgi:hypothetical protein